MWFQRERPRHRGAPVDHHIDHDRRVVLAKGRGTLTDQEVFAYQREVWSRPEVAGYDELMDMSEVEHIALPSVDRVRELASLAAAMDPRWPESKFAIVAPNDLAFGLGRMFETYRGLDDRSTKQARVFRTLAEAWAFLGLGGEPGYRGPAPREGTPKRTVSSPGGSDRAGEAEAAGC
jgi:hypothetical protein